MAIRKINSRSIGDTGVATADIADGSITTAKLAVDAVTTPKIANTVNLGRRNMIINGAMQVAQRGTSATVSNGSNEGYSTIDRLHCNFNNSCGGAVTFSQDTDAPDGFSNSGKLQCSTLLANASFTTNQYMNFRYSFEAQDLQRLSYGTSSAKQMTLSWYMKYNHGQPISVGLYTVDGTIEYYTVSVTGTSSWARYSITIPGSTSAQIDNNTGAGLAIQWVLAIGDGTNDAGIGSGTESTAWSTTRKDYITDCGNFLSSTSNQFWITGIQLEVGDTATPFEHRSYGEELALCQRYYQKPGADYDFIWAGDCTNGETYYLRFTIPVTMRATPAMTGLSAYYYRFAAPTLNPRNENVIQITAYCNSTGARGYFEGTYELDAEL
jgi:hypothetical protein